MIGNITVLQIENIKKIKYLDLKLNANGDLIKIEGPNDAGKSSLLDAIRYAFEGGEIPKDVITHGQNKGTVRIETSGGWIITKIIRKNKNGEQVTELTVRNKDKIKEKAQTFLKELSSKFIDPTRLIDLNENELAKAIFEIFKTDFSKIDNQIEQIKFDLKVIRKQIKDLGAEPDNPELPNDIEYNEEIENKYVRLNQEKVELTNNYRVIKNRVDTNNQLVEENEQEIERLKRKIEKLKATNEELMDEIKTDTIELTTINNQLEIIEEEINSVKEIVSKSTEYKELLAKKKIHDEWMEKKTRLDDSYNKMAMAKNELINKKKDMIKSLDLPIEITENGIFYKQDRWPNLSTSTKLNLAIDMAIKAIPDEGIRVLYMQRGESIGKKKLMEIIKKAHDNNIQIFMEVFKETDNEGIKITKGENIYDYKDEDAIDNTNIIDSEPDLF